MAEDQQLADMMTDKATVEMESPVAGKVLEVAGAVGDMIAIGSVLVVIETEGEASAEEPIADGMAEVPEALEEVVPTTDLTAEERRRNGERRQEEVPVEADRREGEWRAPREKQAGGTGGAPSADPGAEVGFNPQPDPPVTARGPVLASPAVRARARDLGIDLGQVKYAGDRVRHADLDAYLMYNGGGVARGPAPRRQDEQVKVVGLRRKIAENMQEAKRRIPHFTLVEEYDVTALEADARDDERRPRRQSKAHHAALPDLGAVPDLARLPAIERALRRRGAMSSTARARSTWAWRRRPTTASPWR